MKREKDVIYKETEVFELFPKFEYTRRQKARCILFRAYAENFKEFSKSYP